MWKAESEVIFLFYIPIYSEMLPPLAPNQKRAAPYHHLNILCITAKYDGMLPKVPQHLNMPTPLNKKFSESVFNEAR